MARTTIESRVSPSKGEKARISSVHELARDRSRTVREEIARVYEISLASSARLAMSRSGWEETRGVLHAPRPSIETQELVFVRDRYLGNEAIFNPLRSRRAAPPSGPDPAELIERERRANGCRWCEPEGWHVSRRGLWADEFGEIWSADGRVRAGPNWARQAPISGIVLGDERMHNLLRLGEDDFVSLFATAELYIRAARGRLPKISHFMIFMNGGPKSAASVAHAHLQVVGRADRHFGYQEAVIARCPQDYWERVREVHRRLGLVVETDGCEAWANLAPVKERDITVVAPGIEQGARFVHGVLRSLARQGTNNFSIAAIPSPGLLAGVDDRPRSPAPVLFRVVDRGDMRAPHGDFGCMELFGSSVVATDPFVVARWLREGAGR